MPRLINNNINCRTNRSPIYSRHINRSCIPGGPRGGDHIADSHTPASYTLTCVFHLAFPSQSRSAARVTQCESIAQRKSVCA